MLDRLCVRKPFKLLRTGLPFILNHTPPRASPPERAEKTMGKSNKPHLLLVLVMLILLNCHAAFKQCAEEERDNVEI